MKALWKNKISQTEWADHEKENGVICGDAHQWLVKLFFLRQWNYFLLLQINQIDKKQKVL